MFRTADILSQGKLRRGEPKVVFGCFHRVAQETPTRCWINNPRGHDVDLGLDAGAINCTTNPAYCSKLLQREQGYVRGPINKIVREVEDNDVAADRVNLEAAS